MAASIEPFYTALGRTLRDLRVTRFITQEELGSRLTPPMTRANIANIEGGKQRIYAHTLIDIARALDVPLGELLPNAPPKKPRATSMESFTSELAAKLPLKLEEVRELTVRIGFAQAQSHKEPEQDLPLQSDEEEP
jgi:transcriptional regulator with XRE-family HTH domain